MHNNSHTIFCAYAVFFDVNNTVVRIVSNIGILCSSVWGLWLSWILRHKNYIMLSRVIFVINVVLLIALVNASMNNFFMT
ncbi:hypothetical protein HMPREF9244_01324 [Alloscardovia omnicolens F0580]|uniref:Uncharacterized protein n=1 Tax=Alloscardovia omnicolens F0580 TaxID=1321816 RepID=U1SE74_9BIFI|nr:hypothetical protein HMPREF9244_01324 [Alloscardovia omnicolens F0580]